MPENIVIPSASQLAWGDAELGVIIHLDVQVFEPSYSFRKQWGYTPDVSVFNPAELDTDQWIAAAASAGATYAVLVAKHCSGFSLWPTKAHDYSVASAPWRDGKGDIVADFFQSCRKYGLRPGLYCSLSCNAYFNVDNPGLVRDRDPEKQRRYDEMALRQLTELWTNYGKLFEIWFDGGVLPVEQGGPDVAGLMQRLQPDAVVFQGPSDWPHAVRDSGNELSTAILPNWSVTSAAAYLGNDKAAKRGDPGGDMWAQTECDIPNRKSGRAFQGGWFWREGDEPFLYSADELVEGYFRSVAQNANLLIGMVIDNRGLVPGADVKVFRDLGEKLKEIFSARVAKTEGAGNSLALTVPDGARPNMFVLMEDLAHGERVRRFAVEALVDDRWLPIWEGTCIGHKRIERFDALNATQLRLNILELAGEPRIREFSAWTVGPTVFTVPMSLAKRSRLTIGRDRDWLVSIQCSNPNLAIRYTLDGSEPDESSPRYVEPVSLRSGGTVKAFAYIEGGDCRSDTTTATFGVTREDWRLVRVSYNSVATNGGRAGTNTLFNDDPTTYWHTYDSDPAKSAPPQEVVFDMVRERRVSAFTMMPRTAALEGCPDQYAFYVSQDGEKWTLAAEGGFPNLRENPGMQVVPLPQPIGTRFIRFVAKHVIDDGDYVAAAGIGAVLEEEGKD